MTVEPLQQLDAVGPDGVYLGDPAPESPHWWELRAAGVTGTDVVALVGESQDANARTLWHEKRGDPIPRQPAGEPARWGQLSEPMIAEDFIDRHGLTALLPGGIVCNRNVPWMRAQLDRLLTACPLEVDPADLADPWTPGVSCALEIKTRNAFVAGRWRDDVPDDVLAQVAWQRRVTGLDHIHVTCLIGGQRLVEHVYREDSELEEYLFKAADRFWRNVLDDVAPEIEWDAAMARLLDVLVPDRAGERALDAEEYQRLYGLWLARQHAEDVAARAKEAQDAAIKAALGTGPDAAEVLTYAGEPVWTYRSQEKRSVKVADVLDVAPELVTVKTHRVLRGPRRPNGDDG